MESNDPLFHAPIVAKGAALLDEVMPGWADRIDLDTLAFPSCDHCVLGQLYGHYVNGRLFLDEVYLPVRDAFVVSGQAAYDALRTAWVSEIIQRWTP